ncbi:CBS domain-containing protein [Psychrobacillus sp. INOP01]|uniref:CBS domain-containing protein n=1 Tax=Psychrobacillus sp. INOP01 TaxID=2829187 RepID=UPI001BA97592|nr:CBS domain-containing protein [Psychrobacillus sp. INOP01]QUG39946.1 CBS domain-containing protein [Psychrobacillus sp. INOP01]
MVARNSDRFIVSYNRIDQLMKDLIGTNEHMAFFRLIDFAKKKNAVIRRYEADLREYGDLRNAIIHHRTSLEFAIAEPHDEVVAKMEEIEDALVKPITVAKMFHTNVTIFQETDSLCYALKVIKDKKYNQFPVYKGRTFKGLITPVGITMWMASKVDSESFSRKRTMLSEILAHESNRNNHQFIQAQASVFEAVEIFKSSVIRGRRLEALLITEDGKASDKLIGIVTPLSLLKVE